MLGYDGAGNLVLLRTPDGAETGWEYDGLGRRVQVRDPAARRGSARVLRDPRPAGVGAVPESCRILGSSTGRRAGRLAKEPMGSGDAGQDAYWKARGPREGRQTRARPLQFDALVGSGETPPVAGSAASVAWRRGRVGRCRRSGRGVEWQGGRERPQREHFREIGSPRLQPPSA